LEPLQTAGVQKLPVRGLKRAAFRPACPRCAGKGRPQGPHYHTPCDPVSRPASQPPNPMRYPPAMEQALAFFTRSWTTQRRPRPAGPCCPPPPSDPHCDARAPRCVTVLAVTMTRLLEEGGSRAQSLATPLTKVPGNAHLLLSCLLFPRMPVCRGPFRTRYPMPDVACAALRSSRASRASCRICPESDA